MNTATPSVKHCLFLSSTLLALALGACSSPIPETIPTLGATTEPSSTPIPTIEPAPTQTSTEIPAPEITFEQLSQLDPSIGSFVRDEEGNLIYNSPLNGTDVGKNIPVVQQYREVGLSGPEVWIAPEKYPNAPIVIQDLETG